jgi:outer membrane protein assembly factor BamB/SAM-dependent methyltransferase
MAWPPWTTASLFHWPTAACSAGAGNKDCGNTLNREADTAQHKKEKELMCCLKGSAKRVLFAGAIAVFVAQTAFAALTSEEILRRSGVDGGLVVHLGCGDGELTAALLKGDNFLVHGLDVDPENVKEAREHLRSLGRYGSVSVDAFDGEHLPYIGNLVNFLVAEDLRDVPMAEVMRVLAPRGVALIGGKKTVKPWPEELDEWTHHLHDAGGNAVANDLVVAPPRHFQWKSGPLWARSHGWTPSVSAMVSAGGRLFYICDETLTCAGDAVPSKWFVVARDAFSGVLLWKCRIPRWGSEAFSGTPNTGGHGIVGRFTMPPNVGKRLVAVGDTVYVTLGPTAPVTALDAATGKQKRVYAETVRADELLCCDGRLIMSINPPEKPSDAAPTKHVCVVDVEGGRLLWRKGPFPAIRASIGQDPFGRLELAAGDGKVFVLTTEAIECLSAESGRSVWRIKRPALPAGAVRKLGFAGMYEYRLTVMLYHDGVVLLAQPEPNTHHTYHTMPGTLYAFDAKDGGQLWKHSYGGWGHCTPPDVFVVGDLVWTHVNAQTEFGRVWGNGFRAKDPSKVDYRIQALDLRTGDLGQELSTKDVFNVGHHHRCYRNKITERFLMSSRRGVEFVDLATGENYQNHWIRSGCLLGYLPCNGLLYLTPHPCQCYITVKLTGFNALAPARKSERASQRSQRLEKGPAYGKLQIRNSEFEVPAKPESWPTYRHDAQRSGATESSVGADLEMAWRTNIAAKPSGLVVAGGRVLIAGVDTHTIHALQAEDGSKAWEYTAGARINSPPTIHNGLAIFGSADGRVYCLRAVDGALVWRFEAAPCYRLATAFGQLESPWPVPGSVLVHNDKCWFAAGRSSYLDGGIHIYAIEPATGKVTYHETVYSPDPETGKMSPETSAHSMQGLLNDIPATDGANVFIRQMKVSSSDARGGLHLYTTGGYLDPSWFNRTFWQVGRAKTSGLMVLGKDVAYGVEVYPSRSRETVFRPGAKAYRLRCIPLKASAGRSRDRKAVAKHGRRKEPKPLWEQHLGIRVTAMVRAAEAIFVAGAPDIVDAKDPHGAWEGREGGVLAAFAADDGEKLAQCKLPAPPVWDGMAAVPGRLLVSCMDGSVCCLTDGRRGISRRWK